MTIEELKLKFDRGDYVKIARMACCTRKYVYEVMCGRIQGKRGIGKKIIEAAHSIANMNDKTGI